MYGSNYAIHFFYDAQGRVDIARYSGAAYTFVYHLQGDVVAIQDSTGATVVEYK